MPLSLATRLSWHCPEPTDILLQIEAAAEADQRLIEAALEHTPCASLRRVAAQDGIGTRIWLHHQGLFEVTYRAAVEVSRAAADLGGLIAVAPHQLPGEAVPYLLDSRYCAASRFVPFVEEGFEGLEGGEKIRALRDWIAAHYRYVSGSSNAQTTAVDSFVEGRGVCRDFAHTLICFARAAAIPARFASGYGPKVKPQDFHAVAEVYLADAAGQGGWHLVDATGMVDAATFARIGVGRDASDTSFLTSFGNAELRSMEILVSE
ncbi:transglutaminase family protein [Novosphingobium sp. Chol11]|uniref:transglutaminase-like domain-containing protein n=1 Tax=Novosphingobium sp. Chol11 TaxID=1385763 RepID=UPI0025E5C3A8|nr:transglutaminase family protein [Novosphingobium sp. Chol11]